MKRLSMILHAYVCFCLMGCAVGAYPGRIETVKIESLTASSLTLSWSASSRNPVAYYDVYLCEGGVVVSQVGDNQINSFTCLTAPEDKPVWEHHEKTATPQLTVNGLRAETTYVALIEAIPVEDGLIESTQPLSSRRRPSRTMSVTFEI